MTRWLPLLLAAFAFAAFGKPARIAVTPLTPDEVPALLQPPAHGERIIMFWGLDCVYCEPNMRALAKLQRAHPHAIELVTVATDDIHGNRAAISKRLAAVGGMQRYAARAYTEASPQRMNFLVDPDWGGELPRTLVIGSGGGRTGISGELTPAQLKRITPR